MHEIERKFLVKRPLEDILKQGNLVDTQEITQRYVKKSGSLTVRIRKVQSAEKGLWYYLTTKIKVNMRKCVEMENTIEGDIHDNLIGYCGAPLKKTRYVLMVRDKDDCEKAWEIDVYDNPVFGGLIIAEIELDDEDEHVDIPDWVGKEVTHKPKYRNARLVKKLEKKT